MCASKKRTSRARQSQWKITPINYQSRYIQSMECAQSADQAWIHALRSAIHGLPRSMVCTHNIYIAIIMFRDCADKPANSVCADTVIILIVHMCTYVAHNYIGRV